MKKIRSIATVVMGMLLMWLSLTHANAQDILDPSFEDALDLYENQALSLSKRVLQHQAKSLGASNMSGLDIVIPLDEEVNGKFPDIAGTNYAISNANLDQIIFSVKLASAGIALLDHLCN